jgi:hypothetical protein
LVGAFDGRRVETMATGAITAAADVLAEDAHLMCDAVARNF